MKKLLGLLALSTVIFYSCKKTESNYYLKCEFEESPVIASEVDSIQRFLTANDITASYDERGFYYILTKEGEGQHPDFCYTLNVDYKAYSFLGNYIDNGTATVLRMHHLIKGFQYGATLLAPGGSIKVFLPPSLAYGEKGSSPAVGSNEYLIFEIKLNSLTFNNINS